MNTNGTPKSAEAGELPGAAGAEKAPESEENIGTKQKSSCLSHIVNKLCVRFPNGSELREINATLKDMLEEMKKGKEPKKYEENYVPITVERIEKTVKEIDKRTKRQGKVSGGVFVYGVGLTLGIAGYTLYMQGGANDASKAAGAVLMLVGTGFAIWSLVIAWGTAREGQGY